MSFRSATHLQTAIGHKQPVCGVYPGRSFDLTSDPDKATCRRCLQKIGRKTFEWGRPRVDIMERGIKAAAVSCLEELARMHGMVCRVDFEERHGRLQAKVLLAEDERVDDIEKAHEEAKAQEGKAGEWLFFVQRPVSVIVKGPYGAAKAAQRKIEEVVVEEEYVRWFDGIEGVDRALMTEDPVELMDFGAVEEY